MRRHRILQLFLGINAMVLVRILWFPVYDQPGETPWWMRWVFFNDIPGGHYLLNLLLLVPTAVLVVLLWPALSLTRVAIICLAISCLAEAGQFFVPTRVPDVWDIATNTAGGTAAAAWCVASRGVCGDSTNNAPS